MNEILVIEGIQIERVEYNGQPVLSLPMVDKVHQRPEKTAVKAFSRNSKRFIQGVDYYDLPYSEWSVFYVALNATSKGVNGTSKRLQGGRKGNMIFLTLSGYLMLAKIFTDDLSWKVQRLLVEGYFKFKELQAAAEKTLETMRLKDDLIAAKDKIISLHETIQNRKKPKKFTVEEVDKIKELIAEGKGAMEISVILDRPKASIHNFFRAWGLWEPKNKKSHYKGN